MAVLSSIRSRGKLIAICVGGALLAFVLGDFISSGATIFGASQTKVGDINGTTIDYQQLREQIDEKETYIKLLYNTSVLDNATRDELTESIWERAKMENTILKNANDQGIIVTDAEVAHLIQTGQIGNSVIRQIATDRETGMYNPQIISDFISQGDKNGTYRFLWQHMEDDFRTDRQAQKYISMVSAGLYVTTAEVEREFAQRTQISDIKYVAIPYSDIKDEEVTVSDDKIKAVYNENIKRYYNAEETRSIAYVVFDIIPSEKDSADALKEAEAVKKGLESSKPADVDSYVKVNSKCKEDNLRSYYSKGELGNPTLDSIVFAQEPGYVYGPYKEGKYYKVARLTDKAMRSDSVQVSHLLLLAQNPADTLKVKAKADSLLNVYKSGIDFGALAAQFSEDQGSASDSGKLGWVTDRTAFVPEFLNGCFNTEKGKTTIVKTTYGYHIIKVTDKTAPKQKVAVGIASVDIAPSKQTRQTEYARASEFAGRNRTREQFEEAIKAEKLVPRVAELNSNTKGLPNIKDSRDIVKDVFNDDKNKSVSDVYEADDRFIIYVLTGIQPKGPKSINAVKNEVSRIALNDAKGDMIISKLGTVSSVEDAANKMGKEVDNATSIHLDMTAIPRLGIEPKVIAATASLQQGQTSAPIKGEAGVYVLQNTSYTPAQAIQPINVTTDKKMMEFELKNRASYEVYRSLIEQANITDNRVKFF
ncbi:MAG: peptidylprolyl isomerase [Bacteroidales bacterium]|nr:peptidylprolyl isomerase [Bacteroidales bacterium]